MGRRSMIRIGAVVCVTAAFLLPRWASTTASASPLNDRRAVAQGTMADFDGDGRADFVTVTTNCTPGGGGQPSLPWYWDITYSSTGQKQSIKYGAGCDVRPVVGDFNGDGRTDFAYVRPNDPTPGLFTWHILYSSGGSTSFQWGGNSLGDRPVAGDFDGDGRTDFAILRPNDPSAGLYTWWVAYAKGGGEHLQWGGNSLLDIPIDGDFDGDGKTDFTIVRPNGSGNHLLWAAHLSGGGTMSAAWGVTGDDPLMGDFDGNGKADLAVIREPDVESSATYLWGIYNTHGETDVSWGGQLYDSAGGPRWWDDPVPGDFDGDGQSDYAYHRDAASGGAGSELWAFKSPRTGATGSYLDPYSAWSLYAGGGAFPFEDDQ